MLVTERKMAVLLVEQYYDFAESLADSYAVHGARTDHPPRQRCKMKEENVVGLLAI
jgi:ABC-type branched-subunit amino acid transport system ATPase component